jgi:hypothetical protein
MQTRPKKFAAGRRRFRSHALQRSAPQTAASTWARIFRMTSTMRGKPASAKKYSATNHQAQANGEKQTLFVPVIGRKVAARYEHAGPSNDHE